MMDSLASYVQENSAGSSGFVSIWFIIGAVGLYKMFEKASETGWMGIIPFYRDFKLCQLVMNNPLYAVRIWIAPVIPVVGVFLYYYWKYQIGKAVAQSYGKPETWAWGYAFLDSVFFLITGMDDSSYYGVYGSSDTRTGEARSARTVNYEVQKNEPEAKEAESSSDVDFDFNQEVGD